MIAYLLLLLTGGGLAELAHAALHHRAELAALVLAVTGFIARRMRRQFVHTGRRVMSAEAKAAMAAAKARAAAEPGRHETREAVAA